ncbi:MAG: hypothetical protein HY753_04675, partial [Nitrospirae bacterium]|nr:hypothetical protein [Nitrospirota bacterium]
MEKLKVKCHKCEHIIEVTSKKRPLKVKCPECKAVGILRVPPPLQQPKKEEEGKKAEEILAEKIEKEEEGIKTEKGRRPSIRNFLKARIAKPIVIILVIAIILTSLQLSSLISTGETVIIPSDFGIPEKFENAKKEFAAESMVVEQKADDLINSVNWSVEELPERDIIYDKSWVSKEKPEWPGIFEDIENANITPESTYVSWTHTTTADFQHNLSSSMNVVIDDDMIKLQTFHVQ